MTVVPVVIPPGADDLVEVANEASVVVVGLSDRWRTEGLGPCDLRWRHEPCLR